MPNGAKAARDTLSLDDLEALRPSFNRIVRVGVALLGAIGGEVTIRRDGHVWRSSGVESQETPLAPQAEASDDVLWISDLAAEPRFAESAAKGLLTYRLYAGAPIRLSDGSVLGVLTIVGVEPKARDDELAARLMDLAGLIVDDVERRWAFLAQARAQAEASAAQATLSAVVEGSPVALVMTDCEMRVIRVSQRWREERDMQDLEVVGHSLYELFPTITEDWRDSHQRSLGGETIRQETQLHLPNGTSQWLRIEQRPWRDPKGDIGGLLIMSIEVSELVEALRKAEESEKRLQLALEIGELRMWAVDHRDRSVAAAGADTKVVTSRTDFEALTDDVWSGVHPHDRRDLKDLWRRHVTEGEPFRAEFRVLQRDGPHLWVQSASESQRDETGKISRVVSVMRNIDKAKRAEINLERARDAAETANRAKSEFLANMSHEIRTPLNGVMGVASALGRTDLSASQQEMVALIAGSAVTLESLLSDVLDLARIESGRLDLKIEPFDLAQAVRDVGALFEPSAAAKGLDFAVEIAPGAVGLFAGDVPRIRQILSNLVSNAVKFTSVGSVRLQLDAEPTPDGVRARLSVTDTGIGFDDEAGDRLFERFQQADGSITRRYGGTGLGLAISRSLVDAMNGVLSAKSTPGQGSAFTLELGLARVTDLATGAGDEADDGEAGDDGADLSRVRVLLAEDHPTNRRVVELILGSAGVDLTSVENGAEAVDAWSESRFDLILMDMQMPVMDGLSATRLIREREARENRPRTPIFALTANAMPEHARASADAGADGHLTKPIGADTLLRTVADVAAGGAVMTEARRTA